MERVMGIEPTYAAWEAAVLPLNYTRVVSLRPRILLDFGPKMLEISINGEPRRFDSALTLTELLERLEMTGKKLAVEMNGEIVPKSQHANTPLNDGDRLEIVVAVGGG
jgi:sulfur carrier protein